MSAFGCQGSALETAWKFNPSTTSGGLAWLGSPRIPGCRAGPGILAPLGAALDPPRGATMQGSPFAASWEAFAAPALECPDGRSSRMRGKPGRARQLMGS